MSPSTVKKTNCKMLECLFKNSLVSDTCCYKIRINDYILKYSMMALSQCISYCTGID